jgi:hypothetical protein
MVRQPISLAPAQDRVQLSVDEPEASDGALVEDLGPGLLEDSEDVAGGEHGVGGELGVEASVLSLDDEDYVLGCGDAQPLEVDLESVLSEL